MIQYQFIGQRRTESDGTLSTAQILRPVYSDKCALKYTMADNTRYYKPSWDGSLKFEREDYVWIMSAINNTSRYEVTYLVDVKWKQPDDAGWFNLCTLQFAFTDCEVNEDDGIITVKPSVKTLYQEVEDGLDREFNIIKLNPVINELNWDKRAVLQFTTEDSNVVTNCLNFNSWEVEKATTEGSLVNDYHFGLSDIFQIAEIIEGRGLGTFYGRTSPAGETARDYDLNRGVWFPTSTYGFKLRLWENVQNDPPVYHIELYQSPFPSSTNYTLIASNMGFGRIPNTLTNYNLFDTNTQVVCTLNLRTEKIYSRILCDVQISGQTVSRPTDDIVTYNNNYKYVIPYTNNIAVITNGRQIEPNEYGQFQGSAFPGYYMPPAATGYLPVLQDDWTYDGVSMWVSLASMPYDSDYRKTMHLRHAYPLYSCIQVLLAQIAPDVVFRPTTVGSEFLFAENNPVTGEARLEYFITPKSNIIVGDYQTPAYNAPIKLKDILNMLRDVYKCYWFIDSDNNLRIEHISWFMNGGTYSTASHVIGADLTVMRNTRNGKPWSFAKGIYSFGKTEEPATYTFAWMDDVTDIFNGFQMKMLSPLVDKGKNEEVQIEKFTTDIDFVTVSPDDISKDGFMLLGAYQEPNKGYYYLPYYQYIPVGSAIPTPLQNGFLSFEYLEKNMLPYNIAAGDIEYADGEIGSTMMQSRNMEQRNVIVPLGEPPFNPTHLIRTSLGDGEIKDITINLSSITANATLRYDTQQ